MRKLLFKSVGGSLNVLSYVAPMYASKKAIKLLSTPRKGKLQDSEIPILQSAYYEELDYNGVSIATYRWIGKNTTVLLAHGWESNTARWDRLIRQLKQENHNIVALDAPAHGKSEGREFNAILYSEFIFKVAKKHKPEVVIGHSVGGMACVFGQSKYKLPSIKKMVLLGVPAHFEGLYKRYVKLMGYNTKIAEGMNNLILHRFGHKPDYFSVANFSENLGVKGLIIHDCFDTIIPYEEALLLHQYFKNSELITTSNLGHSLNSPTVNENIINFIKS